MWVSEVMYLKLVKLGNFLGCHQLASRSFFFNDKQFFICARCTGIYLGNFIGLFLMFDNVYVLLFLYGLTYVDGFVQLKTSYVSNNVTRFVTGFLSGVSMVVLIKIVIL